MRITCPECATVLKPAKPIAVGKKVKCPKCETTFTVEEEERDDQPKNAKAAPAAGAVKKKPVESGKPEKKPDQKPAPSTDEDDEGGTYTLKEGHEKKDDEEEPVINYATDTSIKDLRGPAQAAVIKPTNMLIGAGVAGFLGWIAILIILCIPVLFPLDTDEGTKDYLKPVLRIKKGFGYVAEEVGPQLQQPVSHEKDNVSFYQFLDVDYRLLSLYAWYTFIFMMAPIGVGMCYSAIQTFGIVKAQNLESRQWGIAGCIMAFIPFNLIGLGMCVGMLAHFLLNMIFDEKETVEHVVYGIGIILSLLQIGAAVYCLMTLVRPEVIDGFEFVPDVDDVKVEKKPKPRRKKRR